MKKILLLLSIFCIAQINAQTFQKTYGTADDEQLGSLLKTTDGGFIMAGDNSTDVYVVKTDSNGVKQWIKTYGAAFGVQATHINSTADGGYIITGTTLDTTGGGIQRSKAILLKIKADGTLQWTKCYGKLGENGQHVQQTKDKGYIVIGNTITLGNQNIYIFKTDSLGTLQWTKVIVGQGCCGDHDFGASIMQLADGNFAMVGNIYSHQANTSLLYIAKLNAATSAIQWENSYIIINPGNGNDVTSFMQTSDKGFIITGDCYQRGIYLVKTDSVGVYQWGKQYGISNGIGTSVIQTNDGGFAFAGNNYTTNNIFIYRTNETGVLQWAKTFADTGSNKMTAVQTLLQNSNGQYILGGATNNFGAGQRDFYLIKTDTFGNSFCNGFSISPTTTITSQFGDILGTKDTLGITPTVVSFSPDTGACTQTTVCYSPSGISTYNTQNLIVEIYPNPAQNNFTIETTNAEKQTINIFDINGKPVLTQSINDKTTIDVSNLNSGVYNLNLISSAGVVNKRLVIVK